MKYLFPLLLTIGLFACKNKIKPVVKQSEQFSINDCFPYQEVDSIVVYYTTKYNNYFSGGGDTNHIHDNQLTGGDFYYKDKILFDTLYENREAITNKDSIFRIQSIFTPVSCPSEEYTSSCEPVYRDVILFYSNKSIIAGIKVCFSCDYIIFSKPYKRNNCFIYSNQYKILKSYFNKNIHPINH